MISSRSIIEKFLDFFQKNDHLLINGSSVIPKNDPTLLYINAGMAAIKNYFTGDETPPKPELCNVQSCIRTIDIDDIGDKHHLTSFQMLGSWSIGAYFKEHAIELAFDFLVNHLNIPVSKLYVSVFSGEPSINLPFDQESKDSWIKVGIPEDHIVSFGMEDNFWGPAAETGPCGPCTEVFYDTGVGPEYSPGKNFDTKRYVEIWNAGVFMMLNKNAPGSFSELPFKSVDTGAGLERLSMTLNGLSSVYDTDLLSPIKKFIESKFVFEKDNEKNIRILTDHLRTVCLILSERQKISNEGRGYIPRKLIRKCIVIAHKNKKNDYDLTDVVEFILENFKDMNEKFSINKEYVISEFKLEQDRFSDVIKLGFEKLNSSNLSKISGEFAFDLVTTFGMPFEVIKDFAKEHSIEIDEDKFNDLIEKHKKISRSESSEKTSENEIFKKLDGVQKTEFVGYSSLECNCRVLKIFSEDLEELQSSNGKKIVLVLNSTPIYSRCGGQESDEGVISGDNFSANVYLALKQNDIVVHYCDVSKGSISVGQQVNVKVDQNKRIATSNAHSATHLLQSALKIVFGNDVHQQGSKVSPNCLHFDFNCNEKITRDHICNIEKIVNENISKNLSSNISESSLNEAVKNGATALFSEKYGDKVRVVSFGDISKELCAGTHVSHTGQIGMFIISSFESVGKGIKRISAFTSSKALEYVQNIISSAIESASILHTSIDKLPSDISSKLNSVKKSPVIKKIDKSNLSFINYDIPFAYHIFDSEFSSGLVKDTSESINGIFLAIGDKRLSLARSKKVNINAKDFLSSILNDLGGRGGGNPDMASGGCNKSSDEIINLVKSKFEK